MATNKLGTMRLYLMSRLELLQGHLDSGKLTSLETSRVEDHARDLEDILEALEDQR